MNIHPLPGRLVVRLEKPPEKIGRLFVPFQAQREPWEVAQVLAVHTDEARIKVGDRVLIPHGTGMATIDHDVIGLRRADVAAILEG
jgi:co-chaperonin GroES (HSP10)